MKPNKEKHPAKPIAIPRLPGRSKPGICVEIILVLILAGIPFILGKYFEFNQPDPFDGGAYAYSAWHVLQGARFGIDEIVSAQPATFMMNYIGVALFGYSEVGPEIIQTLLQLTALGMMFYTLRTCFGKTAAVISTSIASIYLSAPVIAKFGNVKEQFMIPFMVLTACFLLLTLKTKNEWLWAAVGACATWPYFFKPTGISLLAATGISVLLFSLARRQWIVFFNRLLILAGGALAGISPMLLFFYWNTGRWIFVRSFPLLLIQVMLFISILGYAVLAFFKVNRQYNLAGRIRQVPRKYWIAGAAAIFMMHIIGSMIVRMQPGAVEQDIGYYLDKTPCIAAAAALYYRTGGLLQNLWRSLGTEDIYITGSRALMGFSQQAPIVLRYYAVLILPVVVATAAILVLTVRSILRVLKRIPQVRPQDQMALFLSLCWIFDMSLIWVSPRSYEQYYLPMCASAAMLGGYGIWLFMELFNPARSLAGKCLAPAALLAMTAMVWPIFTGITHSPFSGEAYGQPSRGYVQSWKTLHRKETVPWEQLSDTIQTDSAPQDRIYVWGWYPGIYVRAQRLSASPQATEGNMHIVPPDHLAGIVNSLTRAFTQYPPKYIVDTRKREFPWNVPPLELWPYLPKEWKLPAQGFLPSQPQMIEQYEKFYTAFLVKQASAEEAKRFEAMKPFRDYVMQHYQVAGVYGALVLFERISTAEKP